MDSLLGWRANSRINVNWYVSVEETVRMTLPKALEFELATGTAPTNRMSPWLVLQHILHSESDWLNLVEYLAAPYDPAKDSPQSKPFAHRRFQQRGVATPWTDEFSEIVIEFGNETWHNGHFDDWLGFSTRNAVHQGGREYGLFTKYLCDKIMESPFWKSQNLGAKIRFALGANYDTRIDNDGKIRGYGEEAIQANPHATFLGHANYVGPKWETGDYSARNFDDHGVQECLVAARTGFQNDQAVMCKARAQIAAAGHDYDLGAYEGGPGGYALPGSAKPDEVETNEKYGKSLAMAVGALDEWLLSYPLGWTAQCFLGYGQGSHWNSHTVLADGFRPQPSWLAMTLRNRFASGDMITVTEQSVPNYERSTKIRGKSISSTIPLIGCYAFKNGATYSVIILSRKLNGKHGGQDFGDGCSPVSVRMPFSSAAKITLHTLTGDPRLTNRGKMNIELQSKQIPPTALSNGVLAVGPQTGGVQNGMPPGSIFLYAIEKPGKSDRK